MTGDTVLIIKRGGHTTYVWADAGKTMLSASPHASEATIVEALRSAGELLGAHVFHAPVLERPASLRAMLVTVEEEG